MSKYSKINFVYFMQKWMDSVPGQTFLNYAYSWGAAIVILGTLFKLTHLPGANLMLFIGMGTEVFVFFISAFDRPFDKSTIDMTLDNHMSDEVVEAAPVVSSGSVVAGGSTIIGGAGVAGNAQAQEGAASVAGGSAMGGGTIIIGSGNIGGGASAPASAPAASSAPTAAGTDAPSATAEGGAITFETPRVVTPAPAVSQETAEAMEEATSSYVDHLNELNEMLEKVAAQSARLATDSEEMENLNRTLTGIARVYEMQLKSASQQITTQDEINAQTRKMAEQIQELNKVYTRMIEAMTVNMPKVG